ETRFYLWRHVRLVEAIGEEAAGVRCGGDGSTDVFAVEGERGISRGERLREAGDGGVAGVKARGGIAGVDECGGVGGGRFSSASGRGGGEERSKNFAATLCAAAARFSGDSRGASVSQDGVVEGGMRELLCSQNQPIFLI